MGRPPYTEKKKAYVAKKKKEAAKALNKTNPQISFRIDRALKEKVDAAAGNHRRNHKEHYAQMIEDGDRLQDLFDDISVCLYIRKEIAARDGVVEPGKPSAEECWAFLDESMTHALEMAFRTATSAGPRDNTDYLANLAKERGIELPDNYEQQKKRNFGIHGERDFFLNIAKQIYIERFPNSALARRVHSNKKQERR